MNAFDVGQAQAYWRRLHAEKLKNGAPCDRKLLEPVCHPGWPLWFNSYFAASQRRAFLDALSRYGDVRERDVLEVGCGTGRWSRLLHDLGARVRAVDISPDAIESNRRRISGVGFQCADLLDLPLRDECIDLVASVTVIQHVPYEAQQQAVAEVRRVLRRGGSVLLLENTKDRGRHVFARTITGWTALFAANGFMCVYRRGYSYDLPLRTARAISHFGAVIRRRSLVSAPNEPPLEQPRRLTTVAYSPLVMLSRLVEPLARRLLPAELGTHCALVFKRVT